MDYFYNKISRLFTAAILILAVLVSTPALAKTNNHHRKTTKTKQQPLASIPQAEKSEEQKQSAVLGAVVSSEDKNIAREAIRAAKNGDWEDAASLARRADDGIVLKVVKWMEFRDSRNPSSGEIREFLQTSPGWPQSETIGARIGIKPANNLSKSEWKRYAERVRDLMEVGEYDRAFSVIRGVYKKLSGEEKADALFLGGWINLRFLKDADTASKYFGQLHREVVYPVSLSRAQYWLGRSYEAMGDSYKADFWYREASKYFTTYYGQLAALKVDPNYTMDLPNYPQPDHLDMRGFINDERIKAARLLDEVGDTQNGRLFLIRYLGEEGRTISDYLMVVKLAQESINYEWAVMAGKKAAQMGVIIPQANYPILKFNPEGVEKALVMAITRQESQLNRFARSDAGAVGMMQLMPETARQVARQLGLVYNPENLYDKDYNMELGSYYIGKRVGDLKGSYILAIASYNGGIGNVKSWLNRFGDPRGKKLDDIIDWVESIPFSETRNYVQRVIESTQVYRARLNGGSYRLMLAEDLSR